MNRDAKILERGFVARQEARTRSSLAEKRIEGRLTGYETGGEEGENLEDRSTGVTRGESLFMHLRDSGFTKVPPASEREVPGESRYRSNSFSFSLSLSLSLPPPLSRTQIIIYRTYSVLYAGMRFLYDPTQPMSLARASFRYHPR